MNQGAIKFFSARKGFGFIAADEGGKEVFLPATALGAVKAAHLVPGQRVAFETVPDAKGPKVTQLRLLEKATPASPVAASSPAPAAASGVTVYCDPASDAAEDILDAIANAGLSVQVSDITTTPMTQDRLKRLSLLLGEAGQSLVRRSDSLFFALQLDDRFIGEADFWTGIIEHPSLINAPILVLAGKARICKSAKEAEAFIGGAESAAEKPKTLSPRLAALLRGEVPPPRPDRAEESARTTVEAMVRDEAPPAMKKAGRTVAPKGRAGKAAAPAPKAKSAAPAAKKKKAVPAAKPSKAPARKTAAKKPAKRAKK